MVASRSTAAPEPIVTSLATDFATGKSVATNICPSNALPRDISVTAVDALALTFDAVNMAGTLVYSKRPGTGGALNDSTAIMYFRSDYIDDYGKVKKGVPVESLVVRANAGECINFKLINNLPRVLLALDGDNTMPGVIDQLQC